MRKTNNYKYYRAVRPERGFSLIELLFAMVIFATCMLGILAIFPTAGRASVQSNNTVIATKIAQGEIERVKGLGWDELTNFATNPSSSLYREVKLETIVAGETSHKVFGINSEISKLSAGSDIIRIRVIVNFDNADKPVDLETLVYNPEF
jgi:prepilin-type N-terminal cleavage/methylation domain-containing protein